MNCCTNFATTTNNLWYYDQILIYFIPQYLWEHFLSFACFPTEQRSDSLNMHPPCILVQICISPVAFCLWSVRKSFCWDKSMQTQWKHIENFWILNSDPNTEKCTTMQLIMFHQVPLIQFLYWKNTHSDVLQSLSKTKK